MRRSYTSSLPKRLLGVWWDCFTLLYSEFQTHTNREKNSQNFFFHMTQMIVVVVGSARHH
jgi:hypothetical protein